MKNKGFTLIELLAVIVILIFIMILVFPKIINSIKPSSKKVDDTTLKLIYDASNLYLDEHEDEYPKIEGFNYCISLNELIQEDYLKDSINLYESNEDITNKKSVLASYQGDYAFELKDSDVCETEATYVCKAVTESLTGNVPQGDYNLGDEYICEVKDEIYYNFFVISETQKTINLIMDSNIDKYGNAIKNERYVNDGFVEAISEEDYGDADVLNDKGPITAFNFLHNITSSWINLENIVINYEDEGNKGYYGVGMEINNEKYGYGKIITSGKITNIFDKNGSITASYSNLKARFITLEETLSVGCKLSGLGSCPLWMINYMRNTEFVYEDRTNIEGISGYFLLTSDPYEKSKILDIYCSGVVGDNYITHVESNGVRPVINVSKKVVKN